MDLHKQKTVTNNKSAEKVPNDIDRQISSNLFIDSTNLNLIEYASEYTKWTPQILLNNKKEKVEHYKALEAEERYINAKRILKDLSSAYEIHANLEIEFSSSAFKNITQSLSLFNKEELLESLDLLVKLNYYNYNFICKWIEAAGIKINELEPNDLSKIFYGLAKIHHVDIKFLEGLVKRSVEVINNFSCSDLSHSIWALSKLEFRDKNFLTYWVDHATNNLINFNNSDLAKSIIGIAKLGYYRKDFVDKWITISASIKSKLDLQGYVNNAFYLTMILINNPQNDTNIEEYILKLAKNIDCNNISTIEDKHQLLMIMAVINNFSDALVNFQNININSWQQEIDKESVVRSSYIQEKVAKYIKYDLKFNIQTEKFISPIATHVDVHVTRPNVIVQVDGPTHYYSNERSTVNDESLIKASSEFNSAILKRLEYDVIRVNYNEINRGSFKDRLKLKLLPFVQEVDYNNEEVLSVNTESIVEHPITNQSDNIDNQEIKKTGSAAYHKKKTNKAKPVKNQNKEEDIDQILAEHTAYMASTTVSRENQQYNDIKLRYSHIFPGKDILYAATHEGDIEKIKLILSYTKRTKSPEELSAMLNAKHLWKSKNSDALPMTSPELALNKMILYHESLYEKPIVDKKYLEIYKLFFLEGAQIDAYNQGFRAFFLDVIARNDIELADIIINRLISDNIARERWVGFILFAASQRHTSMLELFLNKGIDPNIEEGEISVLEPAIRMGNLEAVRILLENGANPNIANKNNVTPLAWALMLKKEKIVNLILRYNPNINLHLPENGSIIHWAAFLGYTNLISNIISMKNVDVNLITEIYLIPPLSVAISVGHIEVIELLIKAGANINIACGTKFPPLILAVSCNNIEIVKLLIKNNADINIRNNEGTSALMLAVQKGHVEIATLLIEAGANINITNNHGDATLMAAEQRGDTEIIEFLKSSSNIIYREKLVDDDSNKKQDSSAVSSASSTTQENNQEESKSDEKDLNDIDIKYLNVIRYDNPILNSDYLKKGLQKLNHPLLFNLLLELGSDESLIKQILLAVDELGAERVLEIFFGNKIKTSELETHQTKELGTHIKSQDIHILEDITKIEAIIGREALIEITGFYQYVSASLSNNHLSVSAAKVVQIIGNLVNNLKEWLDFGIAYESIDIDNQVTIILSQLEHWFDFVASGQMNIGLPPRYPGFDPDYDPNGGSSGGNGQGFVYGGNVDNVNNKDFNIQNIDFSMLFVGQNTTLSES